MATLCPGTLPSPRDDGGYFRELQVVEHLRDALPERYEIFHSVSWHAVHEGSDRHGEIDIVVLDPSGSLLLMEVKAGDVILREDGMFKLYSNKEHDVGRQCRIQYGSMQNRLHQAGLHPFLASCLVLPDYRIQRGAAVAVPRERIIDADDYPSLGKKVLQLLAGGHSGEQIDRLREFLCNVFRVSPDLGVIRDQLRTSTRRLADGLATWVPRITAPSGVMRIQATAGSGKTQLGLRLLNDAAVADLTALYVCFNRPLADHVARIASPRVLVSSFHELCVDHYRHRIGEPDFLEAGIFGRITAAYVEEGAQQAERFDLIIIDEGQDFSPDWVASLLPQLKQSGRLYLMEDQDQRLYDREAFDLSDAVLIQCGDNFRSPRMLCQVINAFGLASSPIVGHSPYPGELPEFHVYDSDHALLSQTALAVEGFLARGVALADIVVLAGRGHQRSVLLNADRIGRFSTHHFTGTYGRDGNPEWTEGDLLVESVYRFKGQSAPAVVLSEIDFPSLTDGERRKLFVGLTRAQLMATLVLSRQAEACIGALM